ncbi:MAG: hypothetical protein GEU80_03605 [Dehalococcoidia bacterium]|nr:hypothetical protein [Dehalococcoidia bacterium]
MEPAQYQRILLPLDSSRRAEATIPHALANARAHGCAVHLVQVVDPVEARGPMEDVAERIRQYAQPPEVNAVLGAWAEAADEYLASVAADLRAAGVTEVTTNVVQGSPYEVLLEEIDARDCDLVIIATHGRSGLGRAVMGSVADHLIRNAETAVLVIRPEPEDD